MRTKWKGFDLRAWLAVCRLPEIRFGFFIFYLLLLAWPFLTDRSLTIEFLYTYFYGVWAILACGLAIQGLLVILKDETPSAIAHADEPAATETQHIDGAPKDD